MTGGENVDPAEVEAELERVDGIRAACVFGVPDDLWGEIVCVALVAEGDSLPTVDLNASFRERLASHKRPRRVVWLPALSTASSGKLDRSATRLLAEPGLAILSG